PGRRGLARPRLARGRRPRGRGRRRPRQPRGRAHRPLRLPDRRGQALRRRRRGAPAGERHLLPVARRGRYHRTEPGHGPDSALERRRPRSRGPRGPADRPILERGARPALQAHEVRLASLLAAAALGAAPAPSPAAAPAVRVWEATETIPTYEEGPPDVNPPF